uniref:Uncharacterized protein n=1 Tax=Avena sativa TaxID=4498 RepID=A0ACD6AR08_AVESA
MSSRTTEEKMRRRSRSSFDLLVPVGKGIGMTRQKRGVVRKERGGGGALAAKRVAAPNPNVSAFLLCPYCLSSGREFVAPPVTLRMLRTSVLAVPEDEGPVEVRDEEIRLQAAEMIKEARMLADARNLDEAEYKLMDALNLVADQSNPLLPVELQELLELLETQGLYEEWGCPYALASETSHDRQRFAARGRDAAGTMRLFATPRMDMYLKQAKMFLRDPTSLVTSADDDVKEEIARSIHLPLCSHCNQEGMRRLSLDQSFK